MVGEITVPASKSVAHRLLICSSLSDGETGIPGRIEGDDILATSECLSALGAVIEKSEDGLRVKGGIKNLTVKACAKESGSTLRFLLPVYSALGVKAEIKLCGRLAYRPIEGLFKTLESRGAMLKKEGDTIKVDGVLSGGKFIVDGSVSSQYISGLLFALPLLDSDSELIIENGIVSKGYIDLTLEALSKFNIKYETTKNGFIVPGRQKYATPHKVEAEADWSSASFFAVGGALSGAVKLNGININSKQSDRVVIELLKEAGAKVEEDERFALVSKESLNAISFDAENCPDLVPAMAMCLAFAKGVSRISGVGRLKDKESDRLTAVINNLNAIGIKSELDGGALKIYGGGARSGKTLSYSDHRIVMSSLISSAGGIEVETDSVNPISKSYPSFVEDFKKLGGKIEILK